MRCQGVMLRGTNYKVGASERCVVFPGIGRIIGASDPTFCIHLPVSDWVEGDWGTDFEIISSKAVGVCQHWQHDQRAIDLCTSAFGIEWFYDNLIDGLGHSSTGRIRLRTPTTVFRGESVASIMSTLFEFCGGNEGNRE